MLTACAGPHSPFGALELYSGDGEYLNVANSGDERWPASAPVDFKPKRQMLHQSADLDIDFAKDPDLDHSQPLDLKVEYNGRNVTQAFFRNSQLNASSNHELYRYIYRDLRLNPSRNHEIVFYYRNNIKEPYERAEYLPPVCNMTAPYDIINTSPFEPKKNYIKMINTYADRYGLNPNFLAGLIAQESAFDPEAKTWANAVGLTQITPVAKKEIETFKPKWARPNKRDWRLNPNRSIEGGAVYLQILSEYWDDRLAQDILRDHNVKDVKSVILASYNSGAARVKKNIVEADEEWLTQPSLREAFRYVNKVTSYCYHFSGGKE
jgi:soluble lytic murein transglycosylase-like protein